MKKFAQNIMVSTGITLVVLSAIATLFGAKHLFVRSVFESLGANILIHLGFIITKKFESKYAILEIGLDILYTIIVLIVFGAIFDWFSNGTPIWILVIMSLVIYLIGLILSVFRMKTDINTINKLLKNRHTKTNYQGDLK